MAVELGVPKELAALPLARRLAWVTAARLFVLSIALGGVALVNIARGFDVGDQTTQGLIATVAAAFALTIAYSAALRIGRRLDTLAFAQLVLDQVVWTGLVYLTGGASSGATSFYGISCLVGAFLSGFRGAAGAAVAGAVCYVALTVSLQLGWLTPPGDQTVGLYAVSNEELVYYIVVNLLVIVVVTLLGGNLAERLQSAGGQIVAAERRADRAERMAELGRLAAGLAHEIRNPLGSIAGSIQLIKSNPALKQEDRQLCEIIQREAARLSELVSDMVDVSRPRHPEVVVVDVAAVAGDVVDLMSQHGRAVSDVAIQYRGVDVAAVRADSAQLRQLIWNLVRNAVQASSPGDEVVVTIEIHHGRVELRVADTGIGLTPEARERLFDVYFTTRSHGTGIGLAVVKQIADEHGFEIDVSSQEGRGATFCVDLGPLVDERESHDEDAAPASFSRP